MPRLEFSERFANDLAKVTSPRIETRILRAIDTIESFVDFGSPLVPKSISHRFGKGVRKVVVGSCDLLYTHYPEEGLARIEALVPGRSVG